MIRTHEKIKMVSMAIALMTMLSITGTGWAKKSFAGPGIQGTFTNGTRTEVSVSIPVPADAECGAVPPATESYSMKAYIFQPSGRIFAIGISEPTTFTCSATLETLVPTTINAFPGLSFKPGPATLLFQVIVTEDLDGELGALPAADRVIYEYGSRVDLH
ncbi:MAG TPA: hypothetical protein VJQ55_15835 [Candidatus Binatia bacterium]|nr:hypothetical protein [Candidatus Binatia bacterium]